MLTFEKEPFQGTGSIVEKLSVSDIEKAAKRGKEKINSNERRTEFAFPESPAPR